MVKRSVPTVLLSSFLLIPTLCFHFYDLQIFLFIDRLGDRSSNS